MTFQNWVPTLPQPIPDCFSGSPTPLSRGAASLRSAEPMGQAVPRGGELRALRIRSGPGRCWEISVAPVRRGDPADVRAGAVPLATLDGQGGSSKTPV